jgi:NADH dehydrogenase (ubiquinone) Fe-S protein 1
MLLRRAVGAAHRPPFPRIPLQQHRQFSISTVKRAEIELTSDGKKVKVEQGSAIIQACEIAGVQIPRYTMDYLDGN